MVNVSGAEQGFVSAYRLRKTDEYSSVFAFRKAFKGRFFIIHYRPNALQTARLGVVTAKRLAKKAHVRNLLKRIVREQFRKNRENLPALDLIVRLNSGVDKATRAMINDDVVHVFGRLRTL